MLEKVSSDLLSAKLDALLTIAAGCKTFGVRGLEKYIEALWIAIRREVHVHICIIIILLVYLISLC